jgi:ABC-2 type transport system ATP-binding protein
MQPVLVFENLEIAFGDKQILYPTNLEFAPSQLIVLSAPNGAGKSSLLRCVAGMGKFDGTILVQNHRVGSLEAKRHSAFVPDEPALFEDLTLLEHAIFTARVYGFSEARVLVWLERFKLQQHLQETPALHSRGMRQKLALALALGIAPSLLLLDEPYNGLDAASQATLTTALLERVAAGGLVILSVHQPEILAALTAAGNHVTLTFQTAQLEAL